MPSSDHSIPDRRARAIRAIAKSSAPLFENSSPPLEDSVRSVEATDSPALSDESPVLGLLDLDEVDAAYSRLASAFAVDRDVVNAANHADVNAANHADVNAANHDGVNAVNRDGANAAHRDVLHAVACKAAPLPSLLNRFAELGAGCEVASPGELELALAVGFTPDKIVFDSPAKTWSELRRALALGVSINVDSFAELARLDILFADSDSAPCPRYDGPVPRPSADPNRGSASYPRPTSARIGVRINPQSGAGAIGALSTAAETSKFGIGIADPGSREALIEAFLARPWLNQIHVHSGSQGISLEQAALGIRAAVDLALEINARAASAKNGDRQVTRIDIGGGLSVNFAGEDVTPTFADYRAALAEAVPELFDFDIVTEFGRALLAKTGTILTRVETVKTTGGRRIAMTHAGVQVATRTAYAPADWPLRILPFTPDGHPKSAEAAPTDVAGPACFSGDLLARDRMLPRLDVGDLVAVPETGAYYFSNPFSYNLLPRVPVYGYRAEPGTDGEGDPQFFLIRRGQTIADVLTEAGEPELLPLRSADHADLAEDAAHADDPYRRDRPADEAKTADADASAKAGERC